MRCAALIDHLARRMWTRAETVLTPLGLRPRHLVALTMLRDHAESTQQSLSARLQIDRTNLVGLLNELESWGLIERRRSAGDRRRHNDQDERSLEVMEANSTLPSTTPSSST